MIQCFQSIFQKLLILFIYVRRKISEKTQRFDVAMTSLSSDKIKYQTDLIYITRVIKTQQ